MSTSRKATTTTLEKTLAQLDWFGVDLDHTLIRYNNALLLPLIFKSLGDTLISLGVLPSRTLQDHPFDRHFCSRGLIFDARTGDVLRLNARGKVCAARHGYTAQGVLSRAHIQTKYGNQWRGFSELMASWKPSDAVMMATHFDSPAIQLCALLVDAIDQTTPTTTTTTTSYATILPPLFQAFNANFSPPHFSDGTSAYFNTIKKHPHRFVLPRHDLVPCIQRLRQEHHTKMMIVTNSAHDYAGLLLETAFGAEWLTHFDLVVYNAKKKRGFFAGTNETNPFVPCGTSGKEWSEGNVQALHDQFLGGDATTVAYFGDDVWGDTELVRQHRPDWYTVAVVEELEHGFLEPGNVRSKSKHEM